MLARAKVTLARMGPAVWNGGFSTFLAFILLSNTDSHIFTTFFKVGLGFNPISSIHHVMACIFSQSTQPISMSTDSIQHFGRDIIRYWIE